MSAGRAFEGPDFGFFDQDVRLDPSDIHLCAAQALWLTPRLRERSRTHEGNSPAILHKEFGRSRSKGLCGIGRQSSNPKNCMASRSGRGVTIWASVVFSRKCVEPYIQQEVGLHRAKEAVHSALSTQALSGPLRQE